VPRPPGWCSIVEWASRLWRNRKHTGILSVHKHGSVLEPLCFCASLECLLKHQACNLPLVGWTGWTWWVAVGWGWRVVLCQSELAGCWGCLVVEVDGGRSELIILSAALAAFPSLFLVVCGHCPFARTPPTGGDAILAVLTSNELPQTRQCTPSNSSRRSLLLRCSDVAR